MPTLAFESTVFVHGLPSPTGVETALAMEAIAREEGVDAKTIGIVSGEIVVGLTASQIRYLAESEGVRKASIRDLPIAVSYGLDAATTVAATVKIARNHGIDVVCTGGIGGIHRGARFDVSNDLFVLATTPATVVCSGAKTILDLVATRECLETIGVTVVGYQTDEFPGFYSRKTGLSVDERCDTPDEVAAVIRARDEIGSTAAVLVCVPVPEQYAVPADQLDGWIGDAVSEAASEKVGASELTPFLLDLLERMSGGATLTANVSLLENNAAVAAQIALALSAN